MSGITDWNGYVILTGSPLEGLEVVGPFSDVRTVTEWGAENLDFADWWVTRVEEPNARRRRDEETKS